MPNHTRSTLQSSWLLAKYKRKMAIIAMVPQHEQELTADLPVVVSSHLGLIFCSKEMTDLILLLIVPTRQKKQPYDVTFIGCCHSL